MRGGSGIQKFKDMGMTKMAPVAVMFWLEEVRNEREDISSESKNIENRDGYWKEAEGSDFE